MPRNTHLKQKHIHLKETHTPETPDTPDTPTKFTLTIELGNDAMRTPDDVSHVLEYWANVFSLMHTWEMDGRVITDINGNWVGRWEVT